MVIPTQSAFADTAPADTDTPIFDAQNVVIVYPNKHGGTRALNDVSLRIRAGEAVGLVGESGSGKTTLARTLLGLVRPTRGQVLYQGHDIYAMKKTAAFRLLSANSSMVFQDPRSSLNPRLSVGAVVRDPLTVLRIGSRRERTARVGQLLESVGLPEAMATRPVRALSGGQLQRVAIARALAVEPSAIVADEPTSALDVSVQVQVLTLLHELRTQRQLALLIVSHDMRVVRFLTDRTVVMRNGLVVEEGPTEQVYDDPQHEYTQALLAAAPSLNLDDQTPATIRN